MNSKEYSKKYYETHKDEIKLKDKKRYEAKKEYFRQKEKKYREVHKEEIKERRKKKLGLCNRDCFNCIYHDCILPDWAAVINYEA